jgi:hypothetical protein
MIIKSFRIPTNYGHGRFRNHVFRGDDNESITLVQGTEKDTEDIFDDAARDGKTFAVRHIIISPAAETTPEEMMSVAKEVADEFDFDLADAVIIEHQKPRVGDGIFDRHWHILIPDWDRDGEGTVVDTSHNWVRQSKIARLAEWKLGHAFVECPQMDAIVAALKRDGHRKAALALATAFPNPSKSSAAFTHAEAQAAKRAGVNLSEVRSVVRPLWRTSLTVQDFEAGLAKHSLKLGIGTRQPPAWVITDVDGTTLMRVTKAAHVTTAEVRKRLGEPYGRQAEKPEPVRTADGRPGIVADPDEGNQSLLEAIAAWQLNQSTDNATLVRKRSSRD